jgi:hypothetical protein
MQFELPTLGYAVGCAGRRLCSIEAKGAVASQEVLVRC